MDGWERTIPCKDGFGRQVALKVFLTEQGEVAIHTPPGEVAVLPPAAIDQVKAYLTSAQLEGVQQRGKW